MRVYGRFFVMAAVAVSAIAAESHADVVFQSTFTNGYFTPFTPTTPAGVKYGDGGYVGSGPAVTNVNEIILGLAVFNPTASDIPAGTVDLVFTFNRGDPSGLVFNNGATLYSTIVQDVPMPALAAGAADFPAIAIPLPNLDLSVGSSFNDLGFSMGVADYQFAGNLGFQCSTANGQTAGFYTNNASFFNGTSWSLFSFGGDPNTGVANFVTRVSNNVPEPTSLVVFAGLGVVALRRRTR